MGHNTHDAPGHQKGESRAKTRDEESMNNVRSKSKKRAVHVDMKRDMRE